MSNIVWEVAGADPGKIRAFQNEAGLTRPTAMVLSSRQVAIGSLEQFLRPQLSALGDPYDLPGTLDAAKRLWQAIQRDEQILIHGDYDTDGVTATALVEWVLKSNGARIRSFLPHRFDDGYGLTADSIHKACSEPVDLLVTVDCGITSYEALAAAREHGLDVIITDHHEPGDHAVNHCTVIDPKVNPGSDESLRDLAGVGVAFKLCHAFLKFGREQNLGGYSTDLREALELIALGTVADIVPLMGENRCLVRHGLNVLARQHRPGIRALCELSRVRDQLNTTDITFRLAPRLNAAGRVGDPHDTLKLLQARSIVEAFPLAEQLDQHNRERQQIEEEALQAAEAQISQRIDLQNERTIVVWDDNWHQGVVGIVASRLVRKYNRPSIVLTRDGTGQLTGSGRSIRRLNLVAVLDACRQHLERFGGHAMAAGLALEGDNLPRFVETFEQVVHGVLGREAMVPVQEICGEVMFRELDRQFFRELELLAPFGHQHREPVFLTRHCQADRILRAGNHHSKGIVRDLSGAKHKFICFGIQPESLPPAPWNLVYTPHLNRFNGSVTPQLRLVDVRTAP